MRLVVEFTLKAGNTGRVDKFAPQDQMVNVIGGKSINIYHTATELNIIQHNSHPSRHGLMMADVFCQELPLIETGRGSPKPRKPPVAAATTHFPLVSRTIPQHVAPEAEKC